METLTDDTATTQGDPAKPHEWHEGCVNRKDRQDREMNEGEESRRRVKRGFWTNVLSNACGTVLATAVITAYGTATGAIRANPRGIAAAAIVALAVSVVAAYGILILLILPRVDHLEERKAIKFYGLGTLVIVQLAVSVWAIPVYRWAGWVAGGIPVAHIIGTFIIAVVGMMWLRRLERPSDEWQL